MLPPTKELFIPHWDVSEGASVLQWLRAHALCAGFGVEILPTRVGSEVGSFPKQPILPKKFNKSGWSEVVSEFFFPTFLQLEPFKKKQQHTHTNTRIKLHITSKNRICLHLNELKVHLQSSFNVECDYTNGLIIGWCLSLIIPAQLHIGHVRLSSGLLMTLITIQQLECI